MTSTQGARRSVTTEIRCSNCHWLCEPNDQFCPKCGASRREMTGAEGQPKIDRLIGTTVGDRYSVVAKIGDGQMSSVYLAEHITLHRKIAVKVLHDRMSRDELAIERFRREATQVSDMQNPHIVEVFDFGRLVDGRLYLAMEYLQGQSLEQAIAQGPLDIQRVISIVTQLTEALGEAHATGYVHRDLRPRNVFLSESRSHSDYVKLLDFGLAKLVEKKGEAASTSIGMTFGDPTYMSPEQARGDAIDRRGDIYSVGCMIYEMLTGAPPFSGTVFDVLTKHVKTMPKDLREVRADVPLWLNSVVMQMLAKTPDERFTTMHQVAAALAAAGQAVPQNSGAPETSKAIPHEASQFAATEPVSAQDHAESDESKESDGSENLSRTMKGAAVRLHQPADVPTESPSPLGDPAKDRTKLGYSREEVFGDVVPKLPEPKSVTTTEGGFATSSSEELSPKSVMPATVDSNPAPHPLVAPESSAHPQPESVVTPSVAAPVEQKNNLAVTVLAAPDAASDKALEPKGKGHHAPDENATSNGFSGKWFAEGDAMEHAPAGVSQSYQTEPVKADVPRRKRASSGSHRHAAVKGHRNYQTGRIARHRATHGPSTDELLAESKSSTKKWMIVIVAGAALAVGGILLWKQLAKSDAPAEAQIPPTISPESPPTAVSPSPLPAPVTPNAAAVQDSATPEPPAVTPPVPPETTQLKEKATSSEKVAPSKPAAPSEKVAPSKPVAPREKSVATPTPPANKEVPKEAANPSAADVAKAAEFAQNGSKELQNGDLLAAASLLKQARDLDPNNVQALLGLADIASQQGAASAAIGHLKKAAKLSPSNAAVFVQLGEAQLAAGKKTDAATAFRKALTLDADNERARKGFVQASESPEAPAEPTPEPQPVDPGTSAGTDQLE